MLLRLPEGFYRLLNVYQLQSDPMFHPGYRELENELEKAYIVSEGNLIEESHLSPALSRLPAPRDVNSQSSQLAGNSLKRRKKEIVAQLEIEMVKASLARHKGNQTRAAKELEISRQDLIRKIKQHQI